MSDSRTPRRGWAVPIAIVLVLLVAGGLVGLLSSVVRGATWTSESQLSWDPSVRAQFDPDYSAPDSTTFDRQVADQQDVVLSDAVVGRVARSVGLSAQAVRDAVAVQATAGSSVFTIAASASSPAEARRIATQVTNAYIDALQTANADLLQSRLDALTPVIAELRRQLASASGATATPLAADLANLISQQASYQAAADNVPVEATVYRAAATPASPSSLGAATSLIIGAALGAVLGVVVVVLLAMRPSGLQGVGGLLPGRRPADRPVPAQASPAAVPSQAAPAAVAAPVAAAPATAEETPASDRATAEPTSGDGHLPDDQDEHDEKADGPTVATPSAI